MIKPVIGRPPEIIAMGIAHAKEDPAGIIGPWFMAIVGYTFMMGFLTVQATRYFSAFGIECWGMFILVVLALVLATAQWGIVVSAGWNWLVINYGNWALIVSAPWQAWLTPMINPITILVCQLFFAHRCYTLYGRNLPMFIGLLLGMVASAVLCVPVGLQVAIDPYNFALGAKFAIPATVTSLVTDVAITGLTVWKLSRHGATYSPNTHDVLQRLRNITLEAAAPPAVFSLLNMVSFTTMGDKNLVFTFFGVLAPCLYVCSLLFVLNARVDVRRQLSPNDDTDTLSTRFEFSPVVSSRARNTDTSNTAVFSTATVPDFAPNATGRFDIERLGSGDKRRESRRNPDSFAESKSEFQVDLDRWDDVSPPTRSKASRVMGADPDQIC
ncbi:hypothetical protein FRB90_011186 [Tulasnella sp. 427]|nr:hypothetical protein FRB90_011186 [Tulasnella sp. 427]